MEPPKHEFSSEVRTKPRGVHFSMSKPSTSATDICSPRRSTLFRRPSDVTAARSLQGDHHRLPVNLHRQWALYINHCTTSAYLWTYSIIVTLCVYYMGWGLVWGYFFGPVCFVFFRIPVSVIFATFGCYNLTFHVVFAWFCSYNLPNYILGGSGVGGGVISGLGEGGWWGGA